MLPGDETKAPLLLPSSNELPRSASLCTWESLPKHGIGNTFCGIERLVVAQALTAGSTKALRKSLSFGKNSRAKATQM